MLENSEGWLQGESPAGERGVWQEAREGLSTRVRFYDLFKKKKKKDILISLLIIKQTSFFVIRAKMTKKYQIGPYYSIF